MNQFWQTYTKAMNGYAATAKEFIKHYRSGEIFDHFEKIMNELGVGSRSELGSWGSTLEQIYTLLANHKIVGSSMVLLEFRMPLSFRRADLMFLGHDEQNKPSIVLIEIKMWNEAKATELDGIVKTFVGKSERNVAHPSYQVWAYAQTMKSLLGAVESVNLIPLVWMTKSTAQKMKVLLDKRYDKYTKLAPVLFNSNHVELFKKINEATCKGNGKAVLDSLLNSKVVHSKKLAEAIGSMLKGNPEFVLQEQQKIIYETIIAKVKSKNVQKQVFIVKGGPGTGKSVLALNLLATMAKENKSSFYAVPNSSFRAIVKSKVSKKEHGSVTDAITGTSVFNELKRNSLSLVIVDEAHRLKDHRARGYRGKNQIADIIHAARASVFFTDEKQTIRPEDIGYVQTITNAAKTAKAKLCAGQDFELKTLLRTPGAGEYLQWLEATLQLTKTTEHAHKFQTEFKIADSPHELVKDMKQKVKDGQTARLIAGKAWAWSNKINPEINPLANDVAIEEHGFAMPWTTPSHPELWAISEWGQHQVGSVHSAQGSEFDYAYVIIGNDLVYKNGRVMAEPDNCKDTIAKRNNRKDSELFDRLIKQTYRVLLTRGMRGTMVFIRDKELKEHFKKALLQAI